MRGEKKREEGRREGRRNGRESLLDSVILQFPFLLPFYCDLPDLTVEHTPVGCFSALHLWRFILCICLRREHKGFPRCSGMHGKETRVRTGRGRRSYKARQSQVVWPEEKESAESEFTRTETLAYLW